MWFHSGFVCRARPPPTSPMTPIFRTAAAEAIALLQIHFVASLTRSCHLRRSSQRPPLEHRQIKIHVRPDWQKVFSSARERRPQIRNSRKLGVDMPTTASQLTIRPHSKMFSIRTHLGYFPSVLIQGIVMVLSNQHTSWIRQLPALHIRVTLIYSMAIRFCSRSTCLSTLGSATSPE